MSLLLDRPRSLSPDIHDDSTRRELILDGAAAGLLLVTGCGSDERVGTDQGAGEATGAWTYTDSRGMELSLSARPERIVAQASAAAALIPLGIVPVGIYGDAPMADNPTLVGIDLRGITSVGEVFGEINLEALATLRPDLVVGGYYPLEEQFAGLNPGDDQTLELIGEIAPTAAVLATQSASEVVDDFAELAGRLGADLEAPATVDARQGFAAAVERLRTAIASKPGLRVLAVSPAIGDGLYVANPPDFPEFIDYRAWGLDLVVPDDVQARGYFQLLSWELADTYPADLIYYDARSGLPTPEEVSAAEPIWATLPAVRAGQLEPWITDTFTSFGRYRDHLEALTAAILRADADVAS